ncbi:GNAT family N-acetyltransferase [Methylobacterium mesophilicum SR1.6/6]|uniref:GNAT family N-acetyltransferase n=1 Tax=Methylobacterium mesophilicum SR1.6/6 TaxID=908290 RepID=A0A6B9FHC8_9HYPH|nr:GNAT family N-acetyltransferase [Methylobacterium mesophilicum]QGY02063.1 GNAT family N-acetyltransferase [Methylobacterium mesophilicum SR1.6/6]
MAATRSARAAALAVRRAGPEDAAAIAAIHVAAWHETYTGLLPDEMISTLTVEVRQAWWAQLLSNPPATRGGAAYVAEFGGKSVGFGTCNAQRSEVLAAAGFDGEISSLYVLRAFQGRGVGQALLARMATRLQRAEYRAAGLWVLRESEVARRFYERCGGLSLDGEVGLRVQGRFTEVAYGWRDLATLAALAPDPGSRPPARGTRRARAGD